MEEIYHTSFTHKILSNTNNAHFLVIPYPMHSHVAPMIKLSECLASHGSNVTLVITENFHNSTIKGVADHIISETARPVRLVVVPDGVEQEDDRRDMAKVGASVFRVMPGQVSNLIVKAKQAPGDCLQFTCLVADIVFGWASEVADSFGIKVAFFWTSSAATLACTLKIPELIESGFIDYEGTPLKKDKIQPLQDLPSMDNKELPWYSLNGNSPVTKSMFKTFCASAQVAKKARWLLCNWFNELTPSASTIIPNVVTVGPLLENGQLSKSLDPADSTYLTWLDQQPQKSVIYVAFGSISTITQQQLNELASGLELSARRFLWVVRAGLTGENLVRIPDGFRDRVASFGKIVEWVSQEKVLAHPSVSCFLTHCGWNSTMEGLCNGVPLLCWPCFADQPYNRACICDVWKIGLSLASEEKSGIILGIEIKKKIDELLSSVDLIENSLRLKIMASECVVEGGSSFTAIRSFIEQVQS